MGTGYVPTLSTPVELPNYSTNVNLTILQFDSSYYSNILLAGDAVYTWGRNDYGEVGDGTVAVHKKVPFKLFSWDLQGPQDVEQIAAGAFTFYAIKENGKLYAWGRNHRGQLGDKTTVTKVRPVDVYMDGALANQYIVKVCGGLSHTAVLTSNNSLYSFGDNTYGQLGIGSASSAEYKMEAVAVNLPESFAGEIVVDLKCGDDFTTVLTESGKVFAWGKNDKGQCGTGINSPYLTVPTPIEMAATKVHGFNFDTKIVQIAMGNYASYAIDENGKLWAWGANDQGQIGDRTWDEKNRPFSVYRYGALANQTVVRVCAGNGSVLALTSTGNLVAIGDNTYGQLGTGDYVSSGEPVVVKMKPFQNETIKDIQCGMFHNLVLTASGKVFAFGGNMYGQ
ncbi:predicted protein, partial [Naegleria gruberi]